MSELNREGYHVGHVGAQVVVSFLLAFALWCGIGDVAAALAKNLPAASAVTVAHAVTITNTVTIGSSTFDPNRVNNRATAATVVNAEADLAITKTDGVMAVVPGESITYTVVVTNGGPSAVANATVYDLLPAGLGVTTWQCTATAGSSCGAAAERSVLSTVVDLAVAGRVTFTIAAIVALTATDWITNAAIVELPASYTDRQLDNNRDSDADRVLASLLTGRVFGDRNESGLPENDEGLGGISVVITTSGGTILTVTTDAAGQYRVAVPPGATQIMIVESTLPPGWIQRVGDNPTTRDVPAGGTVNEYDGFVEPFTPTPTATATPTTTSTAEPPATATAMPTTTSTATAAPTPTATATQTALPNTATATTTGAPTGTLPATATMVTTATPTVTVPSTSTATATSPVMPTVTAIRIVTATATVTLTSTMTPTLTPTLTPNLTPTLTPTLSPTLTPFPTATAIPSATPSSTASAVATPSPTDTPLPTLADTPTPSATGTDMANPIDGVTLTVTVTPSVSETATTAPATVTPTVTATAVAPTPAATATATFVATAPPTATAGPSLASIQSLVWEDKNNDGIRDQSERGLPNITVRLYNANGELIAMVLTDEAGNYRFDGLIPGIYLLEFVIPPDYQFSPLTVGSDGITRSMVDPATGRTPPFELLPGTDSTSWNAGILRRPTALAEEGEPNPPYRLYLPLIFHEAALPLTPEGAIRPTVGATDSMAKSEQLYLPVVRRTGLGTKRPQPATARPPPRAHLQRPQPPTRSCQLYLCLQT